MKRFFPITFLLAVIFSACTTIGAYENNVAIPEHQWSSSFKPELNFDITDTAAFYNVFIVVRHMNAYEFNNLWIELQRNNGANSLPPQRLNLTLADNEGWNGSGMDDIFEHRLPITPEGGIKLKAGNHRFRIGHIMRKDPLPYIMNIGVRIEKVTP